MKRKKVLVTGASGGIGHAIAHYLYINDYEVVGTYWMHPVKLNIRSIRVDLSEPFEIDEQFDVIVHTAGERPNRIGEKWKYAKQDMNSFKHNNVDTMQNILNYAKRYAISKVIYLSTIGVYGQIRTQELHENSDRINQDAYGITKYLAECILNDCNDVQGISLRMPGVIGPGLSGIWLTNVAEKIKAGEDITIYTPDFETKNFVWIDDLVLFVRKLIEMSEWKYDTLNLACRKGASIRQIVERIKELTNSTANVYVDNSLREPFCIDASKAYEMGYESITPLEIVDRYLQRDI